MEETLPGLNPAAIQRQIQALTAQLLTLTTSKGGATHRPPSRPPPGARWPSRPRRDQPGPSTTR